jgi:threonine synthase
MTSFKYRSTRGAQNGLSFEEAILQGLASDGGLLVPESIPKIGEKELDAWSKLAFKDLAFEIMKLYIDPNQIPHADLKGILDRSYGKFRDPEITPIHELDPGNL